MKKEEFNPMIILGGFVFIIIVLTPMLMYSSHNNSVGGEQMFLTTFMRMISVLAFETATISILIPFFFRAWFKKNLWFCIMIVVTMIPALTSFWEYAFEDHYSSSEASEVVNGVKTTKKVEYYNL